MRSVILSVLLGAIGTAQTYRGMIGVQIEDVNEGSRSRAFVDLGRVFRPWAPVTGGGVAPQLDSNGWPLNDASTVIFDIRACCPWLLSIDDPQSFQPDWSGVYHLSFQGQASIATNDPSIQIQRQKWAASSNTTTADVNVPAGTGLLSLTFTNTRRTPDAAANTGITNMKLIRPGYPDGTGQVYTREFLDSLAPFSVLRYMGFTAANDADAKTYPAATNWSVSVLYPLGPTCSPPIPKMLFHYIYDPFQRLNWSQGAASS